jgi:hypothetical protein
MPGKGTHGDVDKPLVNGERFFVQQYLAHTMTKRSGTGSFSSKVSALLAQLECRSIYTRPISNHSWGVFSPSTMERTTGSALEKSVNKT